MVHVTFIVQTKEKTSEQTIEQIIHTRSAHFYASTHFGDDFPVSSDLEGSSQRSEQLKIIVPYQLKWDDSSSCMLQI